MIEGISDRAVFTALWSDGRQVRSRDLRLRYLPGEPSGSTQVAYSISRKVGNAVVRNTLRRRLRAAMSARIAAHGSPVRAAVVVVFPSARDLSYAALEEQVHELMEKAEKSRVSDR